MVETYTSPPPTLLASAIQPAPAVACSLAPVVSAKDFFLAHDSLVRALVVLCHGLLSNIGTPAINLSEQPWSKMKKSAVRAVAKEYQSEINRRWGVMGHNNPDLKATSVPPRPVSGLFQKSRSGWLIIR